MKRRVLWTSIGFALICCGVIGFKRTLDKPVPVTPSDLHNASVLVVVDGAQGSGTVFNRDKRSFVWTAGHVVEGSDFCKVKVVHGKVTYKARVVRYSSIRGGRDLALLEVVDGFIDCRPIRFRRTPLTIGTPVTHVGSIFGSQNPRSISTGDVATPTRKLRMSVTNERLFDQYDITAYPGCSGGGIFVCGEYVGMLTLGRRGTEAVHFAVPSHAIVRWAVSAGVPWAVDYTSPVPENIIPMYERSETRLGRCGQQLPCGLKTLEKR